MQVRVRIVCISFFLFQWFSETYSSICNTRKRVTKEPPVRVLLSYQTISLADPDQIKLYHIYYLYQLAVAENSALAVSGTHYCACSLSPKVHRTNRARVTAI